MNPPAKIKSANDARANYQRQPAALSGYFWQIVFCDTHHIMSDWHIDDAASISPFVMKG